MRREVERVAARQGGDVLEDAHALLVGGLLPRVLRVVAVVVDDLGDVRHAAAPSELHRAVHETAVRAVLEPGSLRGLEVVLGEVRGEVRAEGARVPVDLV